MMYIDQIVLIEYNCEYRTENCENTQVCYQNLGCFDTCIGPMGHLNRVPQPPGIINVKFYGYGLANIKNGYELNATTYKGFTLVDHTKRIVFLTHGFISASYMLNDLKDALLEHAKWDNYHEVGTVILVDWRAGAFFRNYNPLQMWDNYRSAAVNTQLVGSEIAYMIGQFAKHLAIDSEQFYLIGHSLGGQASSFAARYVQRDYGIKIGRITGLDAAWPCFEGFNGSHLTREDANFVDGIHTNIRKANSYSLVDLNGHFGFREPYAHIDFYPAMGEWQPKCLPIFDVECSHIAAIDYYTYLLSNSICDMWGFKSPNDTKETDSVVGYYADRVDKTITGVRYAFPTSKPPYCNCSSFCLKYKPPYIPEFI